MGLKEIIKKYPKKDINVVWKPAKCMHAAECVKRLPNMYNPEAKPWINPQNAHRDEIIKQVAACPSGALSIEYSKEEEMKESHNLIKVEALLNGPLMIKGDIEIVHSDGRIEAKENAAFCRCGASLNKPFCDGSHRRIEFEG